MYIITYNLVASPSTIPPCNYVPSSPTLPSSIPRCLRSFRLRWPGLHAHQPFLSWVTAMVSWRIMWFKLHIACLLGETWWQPQIIKYIFIPLYVTLTRQHIKRLLLLMVSLCLIWYPLFHSPRASPPHIFCFIFHGSPVRNAHTPHIYLIVNIYPRQGSALYMW